MASMRSSVDVVVPLCLLQWASVLRLLISHATLLLDSFRLVCVRLCVLCVCVCARAGVYV